MRRSPRFSSFMNGRYGADAFGRFLSVFACVCILLSLALRGKSETLGVIFSAAAFVLIVLVCVRIFSRNCTRRREENRKYLSCRNRFTGSFRLLGNCIRQRREYAFFRCPGCKEIVRVPRGKGRIRITCPRCGYAFQKKT